jgi:hypothetical protein
MQAARMPSRNCRVIEFPQRGLPSDIVESVSYQLPPVRQCLEISLGYIVLCAFWALILYQAFFAQ